MRANLDETLQPHKQMTSTTYVQLKKNESFNGQVCIFVCVCVCV